MHPITVVFALLMLAVVTVGVVYLSRRTAWVLACKPRGLYIAYAVLLVYSFLMMSLCKYGFGGGFLLNRLIVTGASLCGIFICLFLCLAVVEVVNRIHYLGRKTFGSAVVLSTFALCAYGFINAAHPRVKLPYPVKPRLVGIRGKTGRLHGLMALKEPIYYLFVV